MVDTVTFIIFFTMLNERKGHTNDDDNYSFLSPQK